jgi:hypothetical protein
MRTIQMLLTITALASCVVLDEATLEQAEGGGPCDTLTCTNSPEVPYAGYHELNVLGLSNAEGISIRSVKGFAQIYKNGVAYRLTVSNSRIVGLHDLLAPLQGDELVDAEIVLEHGEPKEVLYVVRITRRREIPFPFGPPGTLETYRFVRYLPGPVPPRPPVLCNGPMLVSDPKWAYWTFHGMYPDEVLVFEGDRIHRGAKTMSRKPDNNWFNIGCAGHTLAKLHLTRNTYWTQANPADDLSWQARQATLKMLVADYCGTGRAFTVAGTPLVWKGGHVTFADEPTSIEARWGASGATCVGVPRLNVHPSATDHFPDDLWTAIAAECPLSVPPVCKSSSSYDFLGAPRVSANRPPS